MHSAPTPLPLRVSQDLSSPSVSIGDPFLMSISVWIPARNMRERQDGLVLRQPHWDRGLSSFSRLYKINLFRSFSIFNFPFSIFNFQFSIFNFQFSIFNCSFMLQQPLFPPQSSAVADKLAVVANDSVAGDDN